MRHTRSLDLEEREELRATWRRLRALAPEPRERPIERLLSEAISPVDGSPRL